MAKSLALTVPDASLDYLSANITEVYYCVGQPTTRALAISQAKASVTGLVPAAFTKSGTSTARKTTFAAQTPTGTAAGDVDHVAFCSGTTLLIVTTCAAFTVAAGVGFNAPALDLASFTFA